MPANAKAGASSRIPYAGARSHASELAKPLECPAQRSGDDALEHLATDAESSRVGTVSIIQSGLLLRFPQRAKTLALGPLPFFIAAKNALVFGTVGLVISRLQLGRGLLVFIGLVTAHSGWPRGHPLCRRSSYGVKELTITILNQVEFDYR